MSSALWFSRDRHHRAFFRRPITPLVEFSLPPEFFAADSIPRPRPAAQPRDPLLSFGSLRHMPPSKVHGSRVLPTRYVPPAGFGYPLDGLRPSTTGRACFIAAAPVGFHPSELSPLARYAPAFLPGWTHASFLPPLVRRTNPTVRSGGPRPLGFALDSPPPAKPGCRFRGTSAEGGRGVSRV